MAEAFLRWNLWAGRGFPGGSVVKNPPTVQETWVQSLGQEDPLEQSMATHPLQYSCLENPMDRETWRATVHSVAQSGMTEATQHDMA